MPILTPETGHWSTPLRDIVWDKEKQAFRIREIGFLLVLVGTGYVFIQDNQRGIPTIPSLAFTLFKCGALTVVIAVLTSLYRLISDDGKASMDLINTRRNWGTAGVCILCAASFYYFGFDRGRIGVLADQHADQSRRFIHGARERAVEATEVLYGSDLERIRTKHAERLRIAMALYKPNE